MFRRKQKVFKLSRKQKALLKAVRQGDLRKVMSISGIGGKYISPNFKDENGEFPLGIAIWKNDVPMVKYLLIYKYLDYLHAGESFETDCPLLCRACMKGNLEIVKLLNESGKVVGIDTAESESGFTPLHIAAWGGHFDIVKYLCECGAIIETKTKDGRTPITYAEEFQHDEIAEFLKQELIERAEKKSLAEEEEKQEQKAKEQEQKAKELAEYYKRLRKKTEADKIEADRKAKAEKERKDRLVPDCSFFTPPESIILEKELKRGGFGIVYEGRWKHSKVAVKRLLTDKMTEKSLDRFKQEAYVCSKLHHPNITALYAICTEPKHYSIVMELMPNCSLFDVLHNGQPFPWGTRISIAKDITAGLSYLHGQDIVHGDLKSPNVFLSSSMTAKLGDFGFSRANYEISDIRPEYPYGTVRWLAPEQLKPSSTTLSDGKVTDMHNYGTLLWELSHRKIPYQDEKPANEEEVKILIANGVKNKVSAECKTKFPIGAKLMLWCWETPTKRPTATEAAKELDSIEVKKGVAQGKEEVDDSVSSIISGPSYDYTITSRKPGKR